MPRRIRVLERIAASVHEPIVIEDLPRIRHQRIRREERPQRGVVISCVQIQQAGTVLLLPGEGAVGGQRSTAAAGHAVGIVGAVGRLCTAAIGGDVVAAQMVRVQVAERAPPPCGDDLPGEAVVLDDRTPLLLVVLTFTHKSPVGTGLANSGRSGFYGCCDTASSCWAGCRGTRGMGATSRQLSQISVPSPSCPYQLGQNESAVHIQLPERLPQRRRQRRV